MMTGGSNSPETWDIDRVGGTLHAILTVIRKNCTTIAWAMQGLIAEPDVASLKSCSIIPLSKVGSAEMHTSYPETPMGGIRLSTLCASGVARI